MPFQDWLKASFHHSLGQSEASPQEKRHPHARLAESQRQYDQNETVRIPGMPDEERFITAPLRD